MNKPTQDDGTDFRDALRIWGPAVVLTLIGFALAWRYVGPSPPRSIRLSTGAAGGGYQAAGERFRAALERAGVEVVLVESAGSAENLERLRSGEVDVALVQGGLTAAQEPELAGVLSLYLEPLWILAREPIVRLGELEGQRVELGPPGSGTRALSARLLDRAGVGVEPLGSTNEEALEALRAGAVDALARVASPRSDQARVLFDPASGLHVADLERSQGIARTLTFLRPVRVPTGAIDLARDLPRGEIRTVAAAANLLARSELHPAIVGLLVETARAEFGGRGVLEDEGEFPSLALLDVPPSSAARRALERGPSFLYRVLPFRFAALVDRLKILALPFITLLLPLVRVAPPLYRWRVRRRILTWYRRVIQLEKRLRENDMTAEERKRAAEELDRFDDELAGVQVPLSYADELYHLRLHLRMVREDLQVGRGRWASSAVRAGE